MGDAIRPAEDILVVKSDSFVLSTSTIPAEGVYSESDKPVLGYYIDNIYGGFKVDFLAEFRYIRNLTFPTGAESDSLYLVLYYKSFFGDSSSVQEATAYRLEEPLNFSTNYRSDIDVSKFCSRSIILGKQTYTAYDRTLTSAERKANNYCNVVRIKMDNTLLEDMMTRSDIYESQSAFSDFLKGVYVTNTYGQQTVLELDSINLELSYNYPVITTSGDTTKTTTKYKKLLFPVNKETTCVIHVESYAKALTDKPDSIEYISAPGGTFVKLEIPYDRIYERVVEKYIAPQFNDSILNINHFSIVMEPAKLGEKSMRMKTPVGFILIREDDVDDFFVQSLYPAPNIDTVLGVYYSDSTYIFNNAGGFLEEIMYTAMKMNPTDRQAYFDKLNPYYIIPVSGSNDIVGTNATIRHLFKPYGIRLRSGKNEVSPMRMVVTYSNL